MPFHLKPPIQPPIAYPSRPGSRLWQHFQLPRAGLELGGLDTEVYPLIPYVGPIYAGPGEAIHEANPHTDKEARTLGELEHSKLS
jgi:hypothetical protein